MLQHSSPQLRRLPPLRENPPRHLLLKSAEPFEVLRKSVSSLDPPPDPPLPPKVRT